MINAKEHNPGGMDQRISERPPLSYLRPLIIDGVYHDPDEQVVRKLTLITAKDGLGANLAPGRSAADQQLADQQLFEIVCYALELSDCLERREHVKSIKQQAIAYINDVRDYSPDSLRVLDDDSLQVLTDANRALQIYAKCLEEIDCMIQLYRDWPASEKARLRQQQSEPDIKIAACYQEIDAMARLVANNFHLFESKTLQDAKLVLTALIEHELGSIGRQRTIRT